MLHRHTYHAADRYCHEHDSHGWHRHDADINNGESFTPAITLDPDDPFDAALIPIVKTNRAKRKDYAKDGDPFSNFKTTAAMLGLDGFGPAESAYFNVLQKIARLQSLRMNGRMADTANESVLDTYLDLAVYGVILYAIVLEQAICEDRNEIFHDAG